MREAAEETEAELVSLRGRLKELEEVERHSAELKATLETTRDALDELRFVPYSLRVARSGGGYWREGVGRRCDLFLMFCWFSSLPTGLVLSLVSSVVPLFPIVAALVPALDAAR